jgi:hypothetical protein
MTFQLPPSEPPELVEATQRLHNSLIAVMLSVISVAFCAAGLLFPPPTGRPYSAVGMVFMIFSQFFSTSKVWLRLMFGLFAATLLTSMLFKMYA